PPPPPPPTTTGKPNLTTCFYQTQVGVFSLTWSRTFLSHSLDLHLLPIDQNITNNNNTCSPLSLSHHFPHQSAIAFHLQINPFLFWKKHNSKTLNNPDDASPGPHIFWDLSRTKFSSGPEPQSGFYIAVVVNREIVLLVGDLTKEAFGKTKSIRPHERGSNPWFSGGSRCLATRFIQPKQDSAVEIVIFRSIVALGEMRG
ncbi:hypothetical protein LINPERPRIM_LOCUS18060, partial [Linum perenne]